MKREGGVGGGRTAGSELLDEGVGGLCHCGCCLGGCGVGFGDGGCLLGKFLDVTSKFGRSLAALRPLYGPCKLFAASRLAATCSKEAFK